MVETVVRYTVVNQDGKPVIRAVPVRRWCDERGAKRAEPVQEAQENTGQTVLKRIRRFRVLDIR